MQMFRDYVDEINRFFRDNGQVVDPLPEVKIDFSEQDAYDPFIETANYDPKARRITLFVGNRHVKDILRSYCHELFHHVQNLSGNGNFGDARGDLSGNPDLEALEGDAYMNGNVLFRKWTETKKNS